jgi:hypothetical protein
MEVEVAVSWVQPEPPQVPPAVVLEYQAIVPLGPEGNVTVNVCEFPEQMVTGGVSEDGSVTWLTVTVTEAQVEFPQALNHPA